MASLSCYFGAAILEPSTHLTFSLPFFLNFQVLKGPEYMFLLVGGLAR